MKVLVTGGAGFVGSALARRFAGSGHDVVVLDNLHRRGSERNVPDLSSRRVAFAHGDVRSPADLDALDGSFDLLIEASAEPSVHAGTHGSPRYAIDTNLGGAINCLEFARARCGGLIFLSSSRVYSIDSLRAIPLATEATRFDLDPGASALPGLSRAGVAESFDRDGPRSYYGASKLAGELLCQEYAAHAGLPVVINRCGVIAGPGQFGRTDQGVFTLWVARHHYGRPLRYTGFGGTGQQVRDLLHVDDLCDLVMLQADRIAAVSGSVFGVGGGRAGSVSMQEYSALCREACGRAVPIDSDPGTSPMDIPWFITDNGKIGNAFSWTPKRDPAKIVSETAAWVRDHEDSLSELLK